jgi:hypothetical protein
MSQSQRCISQFALTSLCVYPSIYDKPRLGKNVTEAMNTRAETEESCGAFPVLSELYESEIGV